MAVAGTGLRAGLMRRQLGTAPGFVCCLLEYVAKTVCSARQYCADSYQIRIDLGQQRQSSQN